MMFKNIAAISDVQVGDYVLSVNKCGEYEYKKISDKLDNGVRPVYKYTLDDGSSVLCTSNHRVLQEDDGELYYTEIGKCSYLLSLEDSKYIKHNITSVDLYDNSSVIDIEVEDNHNFVLDNGCIVHNSRAGAQVPFSSLNFGTDTSEEGRMVIRNLLLAQEAGLGNGETSIFPITIFKVKEGINYNPEDKNYDLFKLACKVSAKRLFPNFSFIDAPYNVECYKQGVPGSEIAYMGCRTRLLTDVTDPENNIVTGRGNLSFTSINLPRLAIEAKGNVTRFYKSLDKMLNICKEQLLHRYKCQCAKTLKNYPFLMGQGVWMHSNELEIDESLETVLKHGTLSIGFIGLAEALIVLTGKHHGESKSSQQLGLDIITHMREYTDKLCNDYQLNFSVLATPAEGLSGRFIKMDRKLFGVIEDVTDKEYYTNSFHVPVYCNISAFDKIRIEAPYHALTNAGHISYVELDGDPLENLGAFEKIVRYMKESGIGYGSINHPVDRDPVCGYTGIIGDVCPCCGRKEGEPLTVEVYRKIVGNNRAGGVYGK